MDAKIDKVTKSKILKLYDEGNRIPRIAKLMDVDELIVKMLLQEYKGD